MRRFPAEFKLTEAAAACCDRTHTHGATPSAVRKHEIVRRKSGIREAEAMGKPAGSCFKIMGCGGGGGDAVENDDLLPEEATTSADNRRWSFRKRSSKHRVLSNTVISEPISVCSSKESQELSTANLQSPNFSFPEAVQEQEKQTKTSQLPSEISNTEATSTLSNKTATPAGLALSESIVVVFQASIRGYLAREELHKLKCIVKLQAIVRGYLVRKQAIGTLQCIQAIIRMQVLVRARITCQLTEKLRSANNGNFQEEGGSFNNPDKSQINKLLKNRFARQLFESTPRKKSIFVKCGPSESDSVWKWLKRWTAVTSSGVSQQPVKKFDIGHRLLEGKTDDAESVPKKSIPHAVSSDFSDPVLVTSKLIMEDDGKHDFMIENIGGFQSCTSGFQSCTSLAAQYNSNYLQEDAEKLQPKNDILDILDNTESKVVNDERLDCIASNKQAEANRSSGLTGDTSSVRKCSFNHDTGKACSEILENGGKKFAISSRKPCNPAFVAAQSKFEELSSKLAVGLSVSSAYQISSSKSKSENQTIHASSLADDNTEEISAKTSVFYDSKLQTAASECGTEISISSTLDSPDRSDTEDGEIVLEIRTLENKNYGIAADAENAFEPSSLSGNGRPDGKDDESAHSIASINFMQLDNNPAETTTSDAATHLELTTEHGRSLEEPPINYELAADPHGTPSSGISENSIKKKKYDTTSTHRQRLQFIGKKPSSGPNNDSGIRCSTENLSKDVKIPKRHNSFGMAKNDNVEQEPRLSSSNSLPGYMQATASARAKACASTSRKSSPDMQDNQQKKRHSLPIENGKQSSSPRMQRSASQAQPDAKANCVHSPHTSAERKC
ncbi:protein IQ-DOMAIN 32-like [Zingiber officinale]|uniref:protein IQ-DOMAIN 32-like n=1 Tax=Zingiber officinale TaxID=94328 RepID=UPI001C4C1DC7|nr:protein IQ-DOMAIN 32-like [Zingiber officinale]